MKVTVTLTSYSVQKDVISLKISIKNGSEIIIEHFTQMKGKSKKVRLDDLFLGPALIFSINITKNLSLTIHVKKTSFVVNKLFFLMEKETLDMSINTNLEDDLVQCLDQVEIEQGRPKKAILYEITSYVKNGDPHEGKRSIYDLSVRHQEVTLDKLHKMIGTRHKRKDEIGEEGAQLVSR